MSLGQYKREIQRKLQLPLMTITTTTITPTAPTAPTPIITGPGSPGAGVVDGVVVGVVDVVVVGVVDEVVHSE